MIAKADEFNYKLCDILGVDKNQVAAITIAARPQVPVLVEIMLYPTADQLGGIVELFRVSDIQADANQCES